MRRLCTLVPIALVIAVALAACGADNEDDFVMTSGQSAGFDTGGVPDFDRVEALDAALSEPDFAEFMAEEAAAAPEPPAPPAAALQGAERRVISSGFVNLEVGDVPAAAEQVRLAAEALGGFVENSMVSGDDETASAEITIRVPQDVFPEALDRVRRIGDVRSEDLGAQDVTEQFIDLDARLRSALRAEGSLLDLLGRAVDVEDVITIERELTRIRADIERLQGQLNFLERRVALATLTVSLFTPSAVWTEPPSAHFGIATDDVESAIAAIEGVVASVDSVVDASEITISDDDASGFVRIRVHRNDFARAVRAVEALDDVLSKTIRTGERADDSSVASGEDPDAVIEVWLHEDDGGTDAGLIAAIAAPSGW